MLIAAAMPLFARKGFAGTTTKEIARAAGVSEALLFQHFPSKAALHQAIVGEGCRGDPALEQLRLLQPSTATLVRMIRMLVEHYVLGCQGDPREGDVPSRLMAHSYLEDGEYARLVAGWVMEEIFPLYAASLAAAETAGDLQGDTLRPVNSFWFAHHVAAMCAYARLPQTCPIPYAGDVETVIADALSFILRGIGLSEAAIMHHRRHAAPTDPRPTLNS